jgi:hypothetical protein
MRPMPGRECYHCKQWVDEGEPHNCWTTTETALTAGLSEDLREAWERLRETASEFGEQRIYASHNSIMFSRKACYFFVRPKRSYLEIAVFLGRRVKSTQIRSVHQSSKTKFAHLIHVKHRDQVEAPITDWLREAYEQSELLGARRDGGTARSRQKPAGKIRAKKTARQRRKTAARKATKRPKRRTA